MPPQNQDSPEKNRSENLEETQPIGSKTPASSELLASDKGTVSLRREKAASASSLPDMAAGTAPPPSTYAGGARPPQFGDYEILGEIARGGMGVVYKARQKRLNRTVALKMILAGTLASANDVKRFYTEAEAAAALEHSGIVPIYEIGEHAGQHFFSMAYIDGQSLQSLLKDGPLPVRDAAELLRAIAEAVQYAHDKGIVHRDLKPHNILLDGEGKPKVTDFGLAKRLDSGEGMTSTGDILGTPSYMAPEQARGDLSTIGPLTDVYALGAILYATLTGRPPFQAATLPEALRQVSEQDPVSPRLLNPTTPQDLETICLKCLQKEPRHRYVSCQALADDLGHWLLGEPIKARPIGAVERLGKWTRRNPSTATLLCALVVVGFAGALAVLHQLKETKVALGVAKKNAEDFKSATELAERRERDAIKASELAKQESKRAREALNREEQARVAERKATLQQARNLYTANMNMVQRYWEQGDPHLAKPLLESQVPEKEGDPDFRGFEWYYYWKLCNVGPPAIGSTSQHAPVRAISWTPGAKTLAFIAGNQVYLWDSESKEPPVSLVQFAENPTSLAYAPDGKTLAISLGTPLKPGSIHLWDPQSKKVRRVLAGHKYPVISIAYSSDGRLLASGSANLWSGMGGHGSSYFFTRVPESVGELKLWNPETGEPLDSGSSKLQGVLKVQFAADGNKVYAAQVDGTVNVLDSKGPLSVIETHHVQNQSLWALDINEKGTIAAGGGNWGDNGVLVLNSPGQPPQFLSGHKGGIHSALFTPDATSLITIGADHIVRIWDAFSGKEKWSYKGHARDLWALAIASDGKTLATGGLEGTVRLWDITKPQSWRELTQKLTTDSFVSPKGDKLLLLNALGHSLIDVATLETHWGFSQHVRFGRDGRLYVLNQNDDSSCIVSPLKSAGSASVPERRFNTPNNSFVKLLGLSDDLEWIVYNYNPNSVFPTRHTAVFHNLTTGKSHPGVDIRGSRRLVVADDGSLMAATFQSHFGLVVWDVNTGKERGRVVQPPTGDLPGLAISSDGKIIATGCSDGTIRVYDKEIKEIFALRGHSLPVSALSISRDNQYLVSGGWDPFVKIWDLSTGEEKISIAFPEGCNNLAIAADNRLIVINGHDMDKVFFLDAAKDHEAPRYRDDILGRPRK